jgi:hypothetical protein
MSKRYQRTAASQYLIIGLILVGILGLGVTSTFIMAQTQFADHFVIPWTAGRLWLLEGINPYDATVVEFAEDTLIASRYLGTMPEHQLLVEPLINLIFYLPFSLIPYEISRAIWVTVLALCIGWIGFLSFKLSGWRTSIFEVLGGIVLMIFWFPGVYIALTGRLSPIVLLLSLAGIYLILRGQDTTAGFILALTFGSLITTGLILVLVVIWSISRRRWAIISAYFSGLAFLVVVSLMMLPSWPLDWLGVLLSTYQDWDWVQTPLMTMASILPGIADFLSLLFHGIIGIYLLTLWITLFGKSGREFVWKTLAMLVVAFLFHVQGAVQHILLVVPAMFMVFRFWSERWGMSGRIISWAVMFLIAGGSWLLVLPEVDLSQTMPLPLFSVVLPLLVFIGMTWIRWWALKIPKLSFESK